MSEELKVDAIYWQEQRAVYEAKEAAIRRKLQGDLSETYRAHFTEWLAKFPKAYELIDAQIENTRAGLFVDSPLQHFDPLADLFLLKSLNSTKTTTTTKSIRSITGK